MSVCTSPAYQKANYQARIWRLAHETCPALPDPCDHDGHGWTKKENNNILELLWSGGDIPSPLIDILEN